MQPSSGYALNATQPLITPGQRLNPARLRRYSVVRRHSPNASRSPSHRGTRTEPTPDPGLRRVTRERPVNCCHAMPHDSTAQAKTLAGHAQVSSGGREARGSGRSGRSGPARSATQNAGRRPLFAASISSGAQAGARPERGTPHARRRPCGGGLRRVQRRPPAAHHQSSPRYSRPTRESHSRCRYSAADTWEPGSREQRDQWNGRRRHPNSPEGVRAPLAAAGRATALPRAAIAAQPRAPGCRTG